MAPARPSPGETVLLQPRAHQAVQCHILSYVEGATPAIYHAKRGSLEQLDSLQVDFLNDIGVSEEAALCEHNLAL